MGLCLTPTRWSPRSERLEAPFRAVTPEAWRDEVFERIAIWEVWVLQLGGVSFIEAPRPQSRDRRFNYVLVGGGPLAHKAALKTDDRALALVLLQEMRAVNASVRLEVFTKTATTIRLTALGSRSRELAARSLRARARSQAVVETVRKTRDRCTGVVSRAHH